MRRSWFVLAIAFLLACAMGPSVALAVEDDAGDSSTAAEEAHTHVWSDWKTSVVPTCTAAGLQERSCVDCSEIETRAVKATGHSWGAWKKTKAPTALKAGKKKSVCSKCGATRTKAIKKLKAYAKISKKTLSLKVGASKKLKVKYAKGDKVKSWKSSKTSVASVTKSGKVKAKKAGKATITVTLKSGKKAKCKLTVKAVKKKVVSAGTAKKSSSSGGSNVSSGGGTVYWTPSGSVYHYSRDCPTLSRSRVVNSGSKAASGKPRACYVCG